MVALSVQLNAGKVGLCDLTPSLIFYYCGATSGVPPIPTAAPNCNLVHHTWNKMVDEPHVGQKGVLLSVSRFRVRTDPA